MKLFVNLKMTNEEHLNHLAGIHNETDQGSLNSGLIDNSETRTKSPYAAKAIWRSQIYRQWQMDDEWPEVLSGGHLLRA